MSIATTQAKATTAARDFDARNALAGFLDFIQKQGVIGLAIGFILGGAIAKFVAALVSDIVAPLLGLLLGSAKGLEDVVLGPLKIGHLLSTAVDTTVIAALVYFAVKGLGLDKLDKHGEGGNDAAKDELKDAMKEKRESGVE